ncbi:MAG: HEAT repeat domain-containing protein [Verrucomicrobiae bacterium]|nr:HEAT repeat domain-containing protein [Verrucomicrobiae bacterium]
MNEDHLSPAEPRPNRGFGNVGHPAAPRLRGGRPERALSLLLIACALGACATAGHAEAPAPGSSQAQPPKPQPPPAPPNPLQPLLQAAIKNRDLGAAIQLAQAGNAAEPLLRQALKHPGPEAALFACALHAHPVPALAPELRDLLGSWNQVAGYWAAKALGRLKDAGSVSALAAQLATQPNGYWELNRGKQKWLYNREGAERFKQPELAPEGMPNIRVAYAALLALGEIGGPEAASALRRAIASDQHLIRCAAATALGQLRAPGDLATLRALAASDPALSVRAAAAESAAKIDGSWRAPEPQPPPMPPALVFIKAKNRSESNLGFRDSYFFPKTPWYGWGENLFLLSPVAPGSQPRNLTGLTQGAVQGPEVSFDGRRILFAMRRDFSKEGFHIYEMNADGSGLRQLTSGQCNDVDPQYLADGRIAFSSDRAGYQEYYHQERSRAIYVMGADGSGIQQITFNPNQDYEPLALADGRLLYGSYRFYAQDGSPGPLPGDGFMQRIETVLRSALPDGSEDAPFYGAARGSYYSPMRPSPIALQYQGWHRRGLHIGVSVSQPRELPDGDVVCITPAGLTVIDRALAPADCERPVFPEVLNLAGGEEVYIHNHDDMNPVGRYTTPHPAGGDWIFVSHAPWHRPGNDAYGLFLFNLRTREARPVYDDPAASDIEPVPLVPRPSPAPRQPAREPSASTAGLVYCNSVFNSDLPYDRGAARFVRVLGAEFQPASINANASFRSRLLGAAPLEADGSFYFRVPADTPFRFELLNANGDVLVHETEFHYVRPGETKGCVGCHESPRRTPPNARPIAMSRPPADALPKRGDLIFQGQTENTYNAIVRE